ncbi:MAG: RDD family protein [Phycisphaerae bacterium]|nr:RDD family protein [Phycisphaerae bacterium]
MPQYAAPVAVQTVYAGFWLRFVAMIIDQLILLVAGAAGGFVIGLIIGFTMATGGADLVEIQGIAELIGNIFGILIAWLYYAGMESSRKMATLGKMALGLIVTDMSGRRISFGRATGRHFGKIISALLLCIGYFMAGFTQRKQALHDIMASCLVLRRK